MDSNLDSSSLNRAHLVGLLISALVLFLPLFYFKAVGPLDFWWWMTFNNAALLSAVVIFDRTFVPRLKLDIEKRPALKTAGGIGAAALLYLVFGVGNQVSRLLFDFAGPEIANVYALREGASYFRVLALMAFVFGPGEELFWRCFVQEWLGRFYGAKGIGAALLLYAGIHITSGNPMLVLAALVCGGFWTWLYARFRSPLLNMVSHTVWDILVFLIFPFR